MSTFINRVIDKRVENQVVPCVDADGNPTKEITAVTSDDGQIMCVDFIGFGQKERNIEDSYLWGIFGNKIFEQPVAAYQGFNAIAIPLILTEDLAV